MDKNINPINKNICKKTIKQGAGFRIVLTLVTFYLIQKFLNPSYLLIVIPIALTFLDLTDNIFSFIYSWNQGYKKDICTKLFQYQITDKINDWVTYLLAWYIFKLDHVFLYFVLWRGIGVAAFGLTKSAIPLIPFADLMKEYLVFKYFFPGSNSLLPGVIVLKMGFEAWFHSQRNKLNY